MIAGAGWEVEVRDVLASGTRWEPVAFFVPMFGVNTVGGVEGGVVVLILSEGRLAPAGGKLRRTPNSSNVLRTADWDQPAAD